MKQVYSNDRFTMEYCCFGKGSKVFVILPGVSIKSIVSMESFIKKQYKIFTEDYTVYLFDRVNNPPEGYDTEAMADDTAEVMKSIGIEEASVLGVSQGGMIAMIMAVKYPELIGKMVLGSASSRPNEICDRSIGTWVKLAKEGKGVEANTAMIDDIYSYKFLKKFRETFVGMTTEVSPDNLERFARNAEPIIYFDFYDHLSEIKCDTLVIGSKGDRVFGYKASVEIADKIGCDIYMYGEEYGHVVYDEAPDYVGKLYDFFMK